MEKSKISSATSISSTIGSLKQINFDKFIESSKLLDYQNKTIMNFVHQALNSPSKLELVFRASQHNF